MTPSSKNYEHITSTLRAKRILAILTVTVLPNNHHHIEPAENSIGDENTETEFKTLHPLTSGRGVLTHKLQMNC